MADGLSPSLSDRLTMYENPLQLGGIRTGTLDYPNPLGGQSCRVAHVNTGSGLRLVILLDRGADLGEATFNECNLAFLTVNDYKPSNPAYHHGTQWLRSWSGGLLTTCGPGLMGEPREEQGEIVSLHGRFSNTPAAVVEVVNPDLRAGQTEMRLSAVIRDTQMLGSSFEVRRTWRFHFGESVIHLEDEVMNCGDEAAPHGLLYHINLGYPLLDEGARLVFSGTAKGFCLYEGYTAAQLERTKDIPRPDHAYRGNREGLTIIQPGGDEEPWVYAGLVNDQRQLALEVAFPRSDFPRLANWQHFSPRGSYVTALEPFNGSLFGKQLDLHPAADLRLAPGERRRYRLRMAVRRGSVELAALRRFDRTLK